MSDHNYLPKVRRQAIAGLTSSAIILSTVSTFSEPPQWWRDRGVMEEGTTEAENNYAVVNVGQAKWMATQAYIELSERLIPFGGIDFVLEDLFPPVPASPDEEWYETQKAPLNIGQLKALSKPFYDNLNRVSPSFLSHQADLNEVPWAAGKVYPWNTATPVEENYKTANIGQLKSVFAFQFEHDSDSDLLPDFWELAYTSPNASTTSVAEALAFLEGSSDTDGDLVSDSIEFSQLSNPMDASSGGRDEDGDGLPDFFEELLIVFVPEYNTLEDVTPEGDADGDRVSNLKEFNNGLSAYEFDTDGDGYSDALSVDQSLHYRFDNAELNPIADSSGNEILGASVSASFDLDGIEGQAINLMQGDSVVTSQAHTFTTSGNFSMAVWFKSAVELSEQVLWSAANSDGSQKSSLTLFDDSSIRLTLPNQPVIEWDLNYRLTNSLWHQMVMVIDEENNEVSLYVDGQLIGASQTILPNISDFQIVQFGQVLFQSPLLQFNGSLDEIRVYSKTLDQRDVTELFQANDIDNDRIPDDLELSVTGNLFAIDGSINSASDFDLDGILDFQEWLDGSLESSFGNNTNFVISLVSGGDQSVNSGSVTTSPIVFEVTRDSALVEDAPVQLEVFSHLGELYLPDQGVLGRQRELRTDADGRVSIFFRAN